jgi:hypothetical protein
LEYGISLDDYSCQCCIRLGYTFEGFMAATVISSGFAVFCKANVF